MLVHDCAAPEVWMKEMNDAQIGVCRQLQELFLLHQLAAKQIRERSDITVYVLLFPIN